MNKQSLLPVCLMMLSGAANAEEHWKSKSGPVWFDGEPVVVELTGVLDENFGYIKVAAYFVNGFDRWCYYG